MITEWVPPNVVVEVRAADAAARAARAVPGVVRLQPGMWGMLAQLAAQAWEQATGNKLPDIAGVHVELVHDHGDDPRGNREAPGVRVELRLVVDGGYQAAAVGVAVQQAVTAAVVAELDLVVTAVRVRIVEVDLAYG